MASKLILRFDIDTITCVKQGVPSLLRFSARNQVPLSFFANVGRAVNWSGAFKSRLMKKRQETRKAVGLGALEKLGWKALLRTALLDPEMGAIGSGELKLIEKEGHDLGLHGGTNHSTWHHHASDWSLERLRSEVEWGIERMSGIGLTRPTMFASPGFTHPAGLPTVLKELGFNLIADSHGWGLAAVNDGAVPDDILHVTTGMLGEPGGVGFVEHLVAKDQSRNALSAVLSPFTKANQTFVMYDHPCFGGGAGLPMLQAITDCWKSEGGQFCAMSDLSR